MEKTLFLKKVEEALDQQTLQMTEWASHAFWKAGFTTEHLRQLLLHPRKMTEDQEDGCEASYIIFGEKTKKAKVCISGGQVILVWLEYNKVPFIM
ncbi:hypothetical protein G5B47_18655 [Paenibacillus sp. 7124]|uniref:DUF4258 domain-containing protein n=1 Tax=Paenibacillus apii TaxID=1850370 RepID=A0A6M1PQP7_9BACL|nr:hypothetical protein [Paenibacillus apii]NGM84435.1 hypothetical protein [Paenibacillus apii]NJJ38385.1 hypothetical protein [Paenibacillus apii]